MSSLTTENAKSSKYWPRVRLGEVCEVRSGADYKQVKSENGKYPIYGTGGVMGYATDFRCPANSVIVGRKGTLDNPMLIEEPFWNIDTCFGVIPSDKVLTGYLYRFCQSFDFYSLIPAIGRPSTTSDAVKGIEIPLPSLAVQREIVSRLEKELAAVERMAKGFEALKAEADQLFKSTLKKMFEVVSRGGAETRRLGDVGEVFRGDYITRKTERAGSIPVVLGGREPGYYINRFNHEGPCLVVSRSGASAGYVSYWNEPIFITDGFGIEVGDAIDIRFLHYQILSNGGFSSGQDGAAIPHVTCKIIRDREVYLPSLPTQREIVAKLDAARERCEKLKRAAEEGLQTAALMRKAILKEAFE